MVKIVRDKKHVQQLILLVICVVVLAIVFGLKFIPKKSVSTVPVSVASMASDFVGTWTIVGSTNFDNSVVTISSPTATGFTFDFNAQSGADSGEWGNYDNDSKSLVGNITFNNNTAHYIDDATNAIYQNDDGTKKSPCTGDFTLSKNNTTLDVSTDCSDVYAGFGVSFDGTYTKNVTIATSTIQTSDIFVNNNESTYEAFATLVGKYLSVFNQTVALEDDENSTDAQLGDITNASFAVPHAYAESESIVIIGSHDSIWAATIDWDDATQQSLVRYFTNQSAWKDTLPQAIKDWMANFSDDRIVYESK